MKKICFITTVPITIKAFILKLAIYLHENTDWDISFICNSDDKFAEEFPEYIHYFPVKMERGISISGIKAMFEIKKIFKREKFDLIQYSTPNASLYASIAGKLARVPVRLYCQWGMVYVSFSGIKRKIFKLIEKTVCSLSTWIEPDSKSNLEFSHKEGLYPEEKGSVIWNGSACGVNLDKFDITKKETYRNDIRLKYQLKETDFVFGYVGRITRDKGINELLNAFKKISEKNFNCFLMIVGSPDSDDTIDKELFEWAKKSPNVIFTGYTNVVEQYLSAMDVFILPSYREGFGMGVIEAETMGVPVIVTNIPGPTDAMQNGKTGLVVEKANVKELTKAMETLYIDRASVNCYGENARIFATENFEQEKLFSHILSDRAKLLGLEKNK